MFIWLKKLTAKVKIIWLNDCFETFFIAPLTYYLQRPIRLGQLRLVAWPPNACCHYRALSTHAWLDRTNATSRWSRLLFLICQPCLTCCHYIEWYTFVSNFIAKLSHLFILTIKSSFWFIYINMKPNAEFSFVKYFWWLFFCFVQTSKKSHGTFFSCTCLSQ